MIEATLVCKIGLKINKIDLLEIEKIVSGSLKRRRLTCVDKLLSNLTVSCQNQIMPASKKSDSKMEPLIPPKQADDIPLKLAKITHTYRHHIIIFWFILLCISGPFAPNLLRDTELAFTPPVNSAADIATKNLQKQFPIQSNLTNLVILASSINGSDIRDYTQLDTFSQNLNTSLFTQYPETIYDYQSYFSILSQGLPVELASAFLSRNINGTTSKHPTDTIFVLIVRGEETSKGLIVFSENIRTIMKEIGAVPGIELTLTGLPALYDNIMASAIHDLETMDSMVLPIALSILAVLLWSFRLLIIPLAALGVSAALSFATVDGLTKLDIPIITAAPSLMASVFIAMSIDYSMFLLTRFQEEKEIFAQLDNKGRTIYAAYATTGKYNENPESDQEDDDQENDQDEMSIQLIPVMAIVLGSSGKIIVASGTTLVICFAGLLALPLNLMQSIGLSCATSLIYTMVVNLTLCPALIYTFPSFLSNSCLPQCGNYNTIRINNNNNNKRQEENPTSNNAWPSTGLSSVLDEDGGILTKEGYMTHGGRDRTISIASNQSVLSTDLTYEQQHRLKGTCWYKIAQFTQSYIGSCTVILLVAAAVVPLGLNAFDGELSATMDAYLPRNGPGLHAISTIETKFAPGTTYPYRLFINVGEEKKHGTSVLNETFIATVQSVLHDLVDETHIERAALPSGTEIQSYMWATGIPDGPSIPYFIIDAALKHTLGPPIGPFVRNMIDREFTNFDKTSAIVEIALGIPPFSVDGK